jgi:uncharacterized membrane protein YfcA
MNITAESLMLMGGVTAFVMTVYWVRSRELREKYAVGWLAVATLLLLCGLFPNIIMRFAESAHLSYPAAVMFIALALIYLFSLTVSVSLSKQYRRNIRLTQEVAILEERIRHLEAVQGIATRGDTMDSRNQIDRTECLSN